MPKIRSRGHDRSRTAWIVALWVILAIAIAGAVLWLNRSMLPPLFEWKPVDDESGLVPIRYSLLDFVAAMLFRKDS